MNDDDKTAATRTLHWAHGEAEVQRLGAMLAPITFRTPGHADFSPMQVAPWADEPGAEAWPGLLKRLRGDWPCVPFGRTDRPAGLPDDWSALMPGDDFGHGYCSHHDWDWQDSDDPLSLRLAIDYPESSPIRRLARSITAVADEPALRLTLDVEVRRPCTVPIALHPTIRLDKGRVQLSVAHRQSGLNYPIPAEAGLSRLTPGASFDSLQSVPLVDGSTLDLSQYPLQRDSEELLLLQSVDAPVTAAYLDQGWSLQLDWDHAALPDMMLWVSHRGRQYAPWNGRHWALGLEPVNGAFDLGRIAAPPAGHPLATRGVALTPGKPWRLHSEFRAAPCR